MTRRLNIAIFGLSLTSSWGNGHATTYRGLIRGLAALGHRVTFFERDMPWYAANRDLPRPGFCKLVLHDDPGEVLARHGPEIEAADAVITGSYVTDGVALIDALSERGVPQLCFYDIDTPVTLAKLERGDEEYLARRQVPLFDVYFSFSGGAVLERLRDSFGARRAEALYCSVDPERYMPTGAAVRWDLGYLGTYSPDRQPTLERLLIEPARQLSDRRFVVAGSQYPASLEWPANVERIEHLPPEDHAEFYGQQRYTLNVTRADMRRAGWSPSVRLFEAAACGTPVITDTWPGLDDLFPIGSAILTACTSGDVTDLLERQPEAERRHIAEAARRIVLGEHTSWIRAAELADILARGADGGSFGRISQAESMMMRDEVRGREPLRVLVAGGAGFIGSHLCEALLARGNEVVCLDSFLTGSLDNIAHLIRHPRFSLVEHDVCDAFGPRQVVDRIFNLACAASPRCYQADPVHTMLTSVLGTHNLLMLAERHGARFLQASTSEVYGDPEQHPQSEAYLGNVNCTGPRACYDEGKRAAEALCFDMSRLDRADIRVARIFNTYGPRMRRDDGRIVSNFIVQALTGQPLTIYGTGQQTRSFCYVSDMVRGLLALMDLARPPSRPVNLGNPQEVEVRKLARIVQRHTGTSGIVHRPLPPDDPRRRRPDITAALEVLGWRPTVALSEGLALTVRHFRQSLCPLPTEAVPARSNVSRPDRAMPLT